MNQSIIQAAGLDHKSLNILVKEASGDVCIDKCFGQRYIGSGIKDKAITIDGTPGNALGAYLDGGIITVNGNAQDAVGDTMNDGKIIIHGNAGDALGYAMRGGQIYVKGNAGYRTGIHMKEYESKKPVIVIGGAVGSFLGEYMAGGIIVILGIDTNKIPVGNFTGTGMHGGCIYIRTNSTIDNLPKQVINSVAADDDISVIAPFIKEFTGHFGGSEKELLSSRFTLLKPNTKNPYKQLYTAN